MGNRRIIPSLVTGLMLIPVVFISWLLLAEKDRGIDTVTREARGLEYLLPVSQVARLVALHRGLSFDYLNGNTTLLARITEVEAQMDRVLTEVDTANERGGQLVSRESWQAVGRDWQALTSAGLKLEPIVNFQRHTLIIDQLLELIQQASESSGLRFDPEPDSYFMIDAALIRLPRLLEHLGQLRGRGSPLFRRPRITGEEREFVSNRAALIRDEMGELRAAVASASTHNPAVRSSLDNAERGFVSTVQRFVSAAEDGLLRGRHDQTSDQFFALGTRAIDAGARYVDIAEATLTSLLQQRVRRLRDNKTVVLSSSALVVGLIFALATILMRSVIAQEALRQSQTDLEARVEERTDKLRKSESALQETNEKLNIWVQELQQRYREMALLGEMVQMLQTCATAEELHQVASHQLARVFGQMDGMLFELRSDHHLLKPTAAWGAATPEASDFPPDDCWALRLGRPHVVVAPGVDGLLCKHVHSREPYACLPMVAQGETLGILHLRGTAERFTGEHRPFLLTAAENLALALSNARLREALRQQVIRDPLTSLYNRRFMEEAIQREMLLSARGTRPLALVMCDIDHFKRLNDSLGHEAGDAILREVAHFVRRRIRASDIACRYGGEEILIVLPATPLHEATGLAETLRVGVRELAVTENERLIGPVTLSFGVAASPVHGETAAELMRAADAALYQAKAQGRDRVVAASAMQTARSS